MRKIIINSFLVIMLLSVTSCKSTKSGPVDRAISAMERARQAEAEIYAPKEFAQAQKLFDQMNAELARKDHKTANVTAEKVIAAADEATRIARREKAFQRIKSLQNLLVTAKDLSIDRSNPDVYHQAAQSLIDAESFFVNEDYDKARESAESGINLLEPLIGGQEKIALANLNRAREMHKQAVNSTDKACSEQMLKNADQLITKASDQYNNKQYSASISSSESAIASLEEVLATCGSSDRNIRISVDQDGSDLQLQAYNLIHRLEKMIAYLKENNYTNDVYTKDQSMNSQSGNTSRSQTKKSVPASRTKPATKTSGAGSKAVRSASEPTTDTETIIYEDEDGNVEIIDIQDIDENDEVTLFIGSAADLLTDVSYMDISYKAQNINPEFSDDGVITLEMIESFNDAATQYYNEGNYLSAIDSAREGLRIAELFLAGQTLTNYTVVKGDTLWDISGRIYKKRRYWLWPNIWRANKLEIKDPDLIYPKQVFRIPPAPSDM
ncbi:MAG: LysM peptidoglycan-binding domain-containing protein [Brevinemataceae bacterium]